MTSATEIVFLPDGHIALVTDRQVDDFLATTQRALVNIMIVQGQDKIFPLRGTTLLAFALGGSLLNTRSAEHAGNFAASDTLYFGRAQDFTDSDSKMAAIELTVDSLTYNVLTLRAAFLSIGGQNLSYSVSNSLPS